MAMGEWEKAIHDAVERFTDELEEIAEQADGDVHEDAGDDIRNYVGHAKKALDALVEIGKEIDSGAYHDDDE